MQAFTLIGRSGASFSSRITRLLRQEHRQTLLFTISSNIERESLASIWETVQKLSPSNVGCVTAEPSNGYVSCAIAAIPSGLCTTWKSDVSGVRQAEVGRWHSARNPEADLKQTTVLPPELLALRFLPFVRRIHRSKIFAAV
jgi:hypothetical protein